MRTKSTYICFVLAILWAGTILNYTATAKPKTTAELHRTTLDGTAFTAESTADPAAFGDRLRRKPRTEPYVEQQAPPLDGAPTPPGEDFKFQFAPVTPPAYAPDEGVPPPTAAAPAEPEGQVQGILSAIKSLFAGEGDFEDIIKIGMTIFALFGGAQFGSSDILFKTILGAFSQKASFNDILEDRLRKSGRRSRRSRG